MPIWACITAHDKAGQWVIEILWLLSAPIFATGHVISWMCARHRRRLESVCWQQRAAFVLGDRRTRSHACHPPLVRNTNYANIIDWRCCRGGFAVVTVMCPSCPDANMLCDYARFMHPSPITALTGECVPAHVRNNRSSVQDSDIWHPPNWVSFDIRLVWSKVGGKCWTGLVRIRDSLSYLYVSCKDVAVGIWLDQQTMGRGDEEESRCGQYLDSVCMLNMRGRCVRAYIWPLPSMLWPCPWNSCGTCVQGIWDSLQIWTAHDQDG